MLTAILAAIAIAAALLLHGTVVDHEQHRWNHSAKQNDDWPDHFDAAANDTSRNNDYTGSCNRN